MPAKIMTSAAHVKMPFAKRIIAKMLITIPMSVRMLGCTRRLASKFTMESTTRLPPTPMRPVIDCVSGCALLVVMHSREAYYLECPSTRWNFDFDRIAFSFVQEAASNWRRGRNQAFRRIGIFTSDELISDFLVFVHIQHHDLRTQRNSVAWNLIEIDHREIRKTL